MMTKITKSLLALVLSFVMLLSLLPHLSVKAATGEVSGTCGENLTWVLNKTTGILTISGTGPMADYHSATEAMVTKTAPWLSLRPKAVIVEEGVTAIGENAFYGCAELVDVNLPKTLTDIRFQAFSGCSALESISIPEHVTKPGKLIFADCTSLHTVYLPTEMEVISYGMFSRCTSLKTIALPHKLKVIASFAFSDCVALEELSLPQGMTRIGGYAFHNCTALVHITTHFIPTWGLNMFEGADKLEHMVFVGQESSAPDWSLLHLPSTAVIHYDATGEEARWISTPDSTHFFCNLCQKVLIGAAQEVESPFTDVKVSNYAYAPIVWAVEQGITTGTSETTFSPDKDCTRAQIVTFLWRAGGSPEPTSTTHSFTDMQKGAYYYKAVLWAVENGITTGMTPTTFAPDKTCTRGQAMTFLWRAQGKPQTTSTYNPFRDVAETDYYSAPVIWASLHHITTGTSAVTFSPEKNCTRAQIVTFLYRLLSR